MFHRSKQLLANKGFKCLKAILPQFIIFYIAELHQHWNNLPQMLPWGRHTGVNTSYTIACNIMLHVDYSLMMLIARPYLTNSVPSMLADGSETLDVSTCVCSRWSSCQFAHEMLSELYEDCSATTGHQVPKCYNGTFPHCHARASQLWKKTGEDWLVETD